MRTGRMKIWSRSLRGLHHHQRMGDAHDDPIPLLLGDYGDVIFGDGTPSVSPLDANEMCNVITAALGEVNSRDLTCSDLDPTPIQPFGGVRVVKKIKLGSTWDRNDPSTAMLKYIFAPAAEQPPQEERVSKTALGLLKNTSGEERQDKIKTKEWYRNDDVNLVSRETWDEKFELLQIYRAKYGNCLVPHNWRGSGSKTLARWVKRQRYQYKLKLNGMKSALTEERIQALEDVGFVWSSQQMTWEERLNELVAFNKEHGHCNVPSIYPSNRQLSVWVRSQRRQYKLWQEKAKSGMTNERFQKLESLGFDFHPRRDNNLER